jgi:pimeloyl-ACP methyl ester carboxylesterase
MKEEVVLVHGIWMTGLEMALLGRRIRASGYRVRQFRYRSLRQTPAENAALLNHLLQSLDADIVHLVAHSLGGIVVMHLFDRFPLQRPGTVVMLGSPLRGSAIARNYSRFSLLRPLLGRSVVRGLLGDVPRWKGARRLCMIAGNRGFGIGKLLPGSLPEPNDGTVALEETRDPAVNQHLEVPYSHFAMLFSRRIADEVTSCLRDGKFL